MTLDALAVAAWELNLREPSPPARALGLLGLLRSDVSAEATGRWPLGRRNAALLGERVRLLGSRVTVVAECPSCREAVEAEFDGNALLSGSDVPTGDSADSLTVEAAGWRVTLRLPHTLDLIALSAGAAGEEGRRLLVLCALDVTPPSAVGTELLLWPDDLVEAAAGVLAEADPLAETLLALTCPECGHAWDAEFEVAEFFLAELRALGERALDDVHRIARRYGWAEREILSLSPARRAAYIARIERDGA